MITIETPILDGKVVEKVAEKTLTPCEENEIRVKTAIEKIAILEAEHNKDRELLHLLLMPIITKDDLVKMGAVIDEWNGKAKMNNLVFKKEYLKDSYRLCSQNK